MRLKLAALLFALLAPDDPPAPIPVRSGEFPAPGSAREISGELISVDHVDRKGSVRMDRNDSQRTDDYDAALPFTLLPYGRTRLHGSYAELKDVPIGTHLHGQFYVAEAPGKNQKPVFSRVLALEDDFSHFARLKRSWRVDAVEVDKGRLTVTGLAEDGKADPKPTPFVIGPWTRVWKGKGTGELQEIAAGQKILLNLTACTLKGAGRCTDVWLDDESRAAASRRQLEVHKLWQREHGAGCWVESVDHQAGTVTVTVFDAIDPLLLKEFRVKEHVAAAVAEESLRTYDQNNDVRRGPILEVRTTPAVPGSSGVQIVFQPNPLLEGYRPKRYLRVFAGGWRVDDIPREERLYR